LRLPDELREEFLAEYGTDPVEQYGRVMAEYVAVPEELLEDTSGLVTWLERSHDWIATLKPKRPNAEVGARFVTRPWYLAGERAQIT
jgi:TfoX/Sxy family transcriptional regulator of competence genes